MRSPAKRISTPPLLMKSFTRAISACGIFATSASTSTETCLSSSAPIEPLEISA